MSPKRLGLILAGVPLVIMGVIGAALLAQGDTSNGRSTLAVGVIIAATSGTSVLYQLEQWKLSFQSLIHFGIMLVTVPPTEPPHLSFPLSGCSIEKDGPKFSVST